MSQPFRSASLSPVGVQDVPLVGWIATGATRAANMSAITTDKLLTVALPCLTIPVRSLNMASLATTIASIGIGLLYLYRRALPQPIPGIPYNHESANRLMGDVPLMLAEKKNGGIMRTFFPKLFSTQKAPLVQFFRGPFIKPVVAVGDYTAAHNLLIKNGKDFERGYIMKAMWRGVAPAHFVGMEGGDPAHKYARDLTRDLMTPGFLYEVNAPTSYAKVIHFVDFWERKMAGLDGTAFDAELDLHALVYDIIMAAATNINQDNSHIGQASIKRGSKVQDIQVDDLLQSLIVLSRMAGQSLTQVFPSIYYLIQHQRPQVKKAFRDRDTIISTYITDSVRRMHSAGGHSKFSPLSAVDFVVKREATVAERDGRLAAFHSDTIIQVIFGYLLAGHDTTHGAILCLVKRLVTEQEKQQILRQELRQALPAAFLERRTPTLREILDADIPYLDATIEEVLRMHPPTYGVTRKAKRDVEVLGHTIPRGSAVFVSMAGATYTERGYHEHNDDDEPQSAGRVKDWGRSMFPAGEFHPERWLKRDETGDTVYDPKAGPMLSFSAGGRGCWGKKLAYLELKLVVSVLVWRFSFDELPAEMVDWNLMEELTIKPKTCRVILSSAWGDK